MFDNTKNQPQAKTVSENQVSDLSDFVIHVMPEAFKQKKTVIKEEKKPLQKPAELKPLPKPVAKPAVMAPKPATKPVVAPAAKKKSRLPLILSFAGLLVVIALAALGYLAIKSLETPVVEEPVVEERPVVEEPIVEAPVIRPGSDLDSDGLSDIEEVMYGTDVRNPDSDGDTFLDGNEVFHRYSPLGLAPQTLLQTGAVRLYENLDYGLTLTYPTQWTVASEVNAEFEQTQDIIFRTNSTATIRLLIFETDLSFEEWYADHAVGEVDVEDLTTTLTKEGFIAYTSPDELLAYVVADGLICVFKHDLADELEIVYLQTFQMMINSFLLK